jgi:reductive dehalogenase
MDLKRIGTLDRPAYQVDEARYQRFDESEQTFNTLSREIGQRWRSALGKKSMENFLASRTAVKHELDSRAEVRSQLAANFGLGVFNSMAGHEGSGQGNVGLLSLDPMYVPRALAPGGGLPPDATDAAELTRQVKVMARMVGSDLVGVCRLDRRWVYASSQRNPEDPEAPQRKPIVFRDQPLPEETDAELVIPESVQYGIVMATEMPRQLVQTSPTLTSSAAVLSGYSRMAIAVSSLAEFIRTMGYVAIPAMNGTALSVPMAVDAGLGTCGRHGMLITPEFGSCVRLCKVLTSMPLVPDKPIEFGAERFCESCTKCVTRCPSRCISESEPSWSGTSVNNPGVRKWYNDYRKCLDYWIKNGTACIHCVAVCPFTKGPMWAHRVTQWTVRHLPGLNRVWVKLDDLLGYGEERDSRDLWDVPVGTYGLDPGKLRATRYGRP